MVSDRLGFGRRKSESPNFAMMRFAFAWLLTAVGCVQLVVAAESQPRSSLGTLPSTGAREAVERVVFRPAYAPGPADNPLKGFVPYAGQGRMFPHALDLGYLSLASLMTGPTNFNWAPLERLLDDIASRGCQSVFRVNGVPAQAQRRAGVPC